jgi:hypothetical protein
MRAAAIPILSAVFLWSLWNYAAATPQLAKGRPCSTCHAGSPPSKKYVK